MSVNNVTNDYSVSTTQQRETESASSGSDSIDFMTLLIAQLTNQDPLNPMEDMDFTSQLAQLEALDQQIQTNDYLASMLSDTKMQSATSMIGKEITGVDTEGETVTGTAEKVIQSDGDVFIMLSTGETISVGNVTNVSSSESSISSQMASAANTIGLWVEGSSATTSEDVAGIVEEVVNVDGKVQLKLYGGEYVDWDSISGLRSPTEDESWYLLADSVRENLEKAEALLGTTVDGTDADGNSVTGIVANAQLGSDSEVYLILFDGTLVNVDTVNSDSRTPDAEDAKRDLLGLQAAGIDENGDTVSGIIVDAEDREDGLALILDNGLHVYYDSLTELATPETSDAETVAE